MFHRKESVRQLNLMVNNEKRMTIKPGTLALELKIYNDTVLTAVEQFVNALIKRSNAVIAEMFEVSSYVSVNAFKTFDVMAKDAYKDFVEDGDLAQIKYMDENPKLYPNIQRDLQKDDFVPAVKTILNGRSGLLSYFIEKDRELLNKDFSDGNTLFTIAISARQAICLAMLDYKNQQYFNVETNNSNHYRMLDSKKDSAAHMCIILRDPELLEFVIINEPKLLKIENKNGQTPMKYIEDKIAYCKKNIETRNNKSSSEQFYGGQQFSGEELQILERCKQVLETCITALQKMKTNDAQKE